MDELEGRLAPAVDLTWIPLGAGGYVVRLSGKLYEALKALAEHRPRLDLYHSALQIRLPDDRFVIECAAILNLRGDERGVVAGGPVGMSWLGRTGEMWNSNSLISWLLARAGIEADLLQPPAGGRAPGWNAGLVVARRQMQYGTAPRRAATRGGT
jgi:hypothetical protein